MLRSMLYDFHIVSFFHKMCVIFSLLATVIVSLVTACPDGWVQHGDSCYHFSHDLETWPGAKIICVGLGGYLVQVNSIAESHYLTSQTKLMVPGGGFWTGLNDLQEEGVYRWTNDNTILDPSLASLWLKGQPNNANNNDNCVYYPDHSDGWDDGICGYTPGIKYICEKPITETSHEIVG